MFVIFDMRVFFRIVVEYMEISKANIFYSSLRVIIRFLNICFSRKEFFELDDRLLSNPVF